MRRTINKIVGIKDNEVYVLEEVFGDNGFIGATGYHLRPLTKREIEDRKDPENMRELWKQAVEADQTDLGLEEWAEEVNDEAEMEGRAYAFHDDSFVEDFLELVKELPTKQRKQVEALTDCTWEAGGCGRCFDKDMKFDVVFDKELVKLINQYQEK